MRGKKGRLFVWRSRRCRIVDRFVTSHDGVEGRLRLRRRVMPGRREGGGGVRAAWRWWWKGEGRMEGIGTSQVN